MTNVVRLMFILAAWSATSFEIVCGQSNDEVRSRVERAIMRLESQDYSWAASGVSGFRNRTAVKVEGWSRPDGLFVARTSIFNQPAESVIWGDKAVLRIGTDSWSRVDVNGDGYRSSGPAMTLVRSLKSPHTELRALVATASRLDDAGSEIRLTLDSDAAAKLLDSRRTEEPLEGLHASVAIEFQADEIQSYAVEVFGKSGSRDTQQSWNQKIVTSLAHPAIDWKMVIAAEAEQKLNEPVPESEGRLSSEEERELFLHYGKRSIRVHDPSSIVRCGDRYWMFSTGTGILSWWSTDLDEWHSGPAVLENMPDWVKSVVPEHRGH